MVLWIGRSTTLLNGQAHSVMDPTHPKLRGLNTEKAQGPRREKRDEDETLQWFGPVAEHGQELRVWVNPITQRLQTGSGTGFVI